MFFSNFIVINRHRSELLWVRILSLSTNEIHMCKDVYCIQVSRVELLVCCYLIICSSEAVGTGFQEKDLERSDYVSCRIIPRIL